MKLFRKIMVFAIVCFFIGAGVLQSIAKENEYIENGVISLKNIYDEKINYSDTSLANIFNDRILLFSQGLYLSFPTFHVFLSDEGKGFSVYEDFWDVNDEICEVFWWGIPLHGSTSNPSCDGSAGDMSFKITFYDDNHGSRSREPNDMIESFDANADQVHLSGWINFTINGKSYHFIQFSYELPLPVEVSDGNGWVSIKSVDDDTNDYFGWLTSNKGNDFFYQNGGKSANVAFDLYNINDPPKKPSIPMGGTKCEVGEECTYSTNTTDPNDDQIWYNWDWGDGTTSDWIGPYLSGEICETTHVWQKSGDYEIKVKAKDEHDVQSEWCYIHIF